MSRIGKKTFIKSPDTSVILKDNIVEVKNSNLINSFIMDKSFVLEIEGNNINVVPRDMTSFDNAKWGLYASLLNSAIIGVEKGFEKTMILFGVGYKARLESDQLVLNLGYSHPINYKIPTDVKIEVIDNLKIIVKGHNKGKVGQVSACIKSFRKPEPYKGKGVRYENEQIKLKSIKTKA